MSFDPERCSGNVIAGCEAGTGIYTSMVGVTRRGSGALVWGGEAGPNKQHEVFVSDATASSTVAMNVTQMHILIVDNCGCPKLGVMCFEHNSLVLPDCVSVWTVLFCTENCMISKPLSSSGAPPLMTLSTSATCRGDVLSAVLG